MINFRDSIYYPFVHKKKLLYFLIVLIPLIGLLAYIGYLVKVLREVLKEDDNFAPDFGGFWANAGTGLVSFMYLSIWLVIGYAIFLVPYVNYPFLLILIFFLPIFFIQFSRDLIFHDGFDVKNVFEILSYDLSEYIGTWLKVLALASFYALLSFPAITVVLTAPSALLSIIFLFGQYFRFAHIREDNLKMETKIVRMLENDQKKDIRPARRNQSPLSHSKHKKNL